MYYAQIPVAHVEAGLRTFDLYSPWPEEANRQITSVIADRHYAPTQLAKNNLNREAVKEDRIVITGNTVIDALLLIEKRLKNDVEFLAVVVKQFDFIEPNKKTHINHGASAREFWWWFCEYM